MIVLLSEICRLILGFLEEELLFETYATFLTECKHLEECRIYIDRGIQFSTKIHGKTLRQLLSDYEIAKKSSIETQTDDCGLIDQKRASVQEGNQRNTVSFDLDALQPARNTQELDAEPPEMNLISGQFQEPFRPNQKTSKRKMNRPSAPLRRKNSALMTPTKKEVLTEANKSSSDTDTNDSIIDIEFFIKNLCKNDFPEQLAKSINQIKTKKITKDNPKEQQPCTSKKAETTEPTKLKSFSLEKKLAAFQPKIVPKTKSDATEVSKPEVATTQQPQTLDVEENPDDNLANILNIRTDLTQQNDNNSFDPFSPFQTQQPIGNDEISYLADYFSEPAFATLYEAINQDECVLGLNDSGTISEICPTPNSEAYLTNNNSICEQTVEPVANAPESNKTIVQENVTSTADSINTTIVQSNQSIVSVAENKKSMIVITNSKCELNKIENELKAKYGTSASSVELNSANAEQGEQENKDDKSARFTLDSTLSSAESSQVDTPLEVQKSLKPTLSNEIIPCGQVTQNVNDTTPQKTVLLSKQSQQSQIANSKTSTPSKLQDVNDSNKDSLIEVEAEKAQVKENKQINDISHTSYTSGSSTSRHQSPLILRQTDTGLEEAVSSFGEKLAGHFENNSSPSPGTKQRPKQETIGQILESQNKLYTVMNSDHMKVTQKKKLNESLNTSLNTSMKSKRKRNYFEDFTVNILGDDWEKESGDTDDDKRSRYTEADIA